MTHTLNKIGILAGITFLTTLLSMPSAAFADRKNPLDGQPAVRHRMLLVNKRFEVAAAFEATINADYKHTVAAGLKVEYHLTDMWSVGGVGFFGTSFNTGLTKKIRDTLPNSLRCVRDQPCDTNSNLALSEPTPNKSEFLQHMNKIPVHGAAYVSLTPWYGKLAAFGKAFVNFDFYFQGGLSFANLTNDCDSLAVCNDPVPAGGQVAGEMNPRLPDNQPANDSPLNSGTKIGLYIGAGIHVFLNDFIAVDFTVRDYLFSDNPSGLDFTADLKVQDDDTRFLNHIFMGVGVSIMLPMKVKRTR